MLKMLDEVTWRYDLMLVQETSTEVCLQPYRAIKRYRLLVLKAGEHLLKLSLFPRFSLSFACSFLCRSSGLVLR